MGGPHDGDLCPVMANMVEGGMIILHEYACTCGALHQLNDDLTRWVYVETLTAAELKRRYGVERALCHE